MKKEIILKLSVVLTALLLLTAAFASCGSKAYDSMGDADYNTMEDIKEETAPGSDLPTAEQKGEMSEGADTSGEYVPKIIRTVEVNAETENFSSAIGNIESKVKSFGGYIENSDIQNTRTSSNGYKTYGYAKYVLRIPADRLDEFLAEAGELFSITSTASNATDVSSDYYDIQARINVLESEKALLEKMLSEATTTEKMINIEERLYEVIYEIESYKTALKVYDNKVAYSTVTLSISEVTSLTPIVEDNSFGTRLKNAITESWHNFLDFCMDTLIFLVYAAPVLAVLSVIAIAVAAAVLIIALIIRGAVRRSRRKKAAQ